LEIKFSLGKGRIGFEEVHDVFGPVGHVFSDHEGEMASFNFLVVDDCFTDGVTSPLSVLRVGKLVSFTNNHSGRYSDVLDRDQVSLSVLADVKVLVVFRSKHLETIFFHVLSVKKHALSGCAVRFVIHVDLEAVQIISLRVR